MRYVISPLSTPRIEAFIIEELGRSPGLAKSLVGALKLIGKHCVLHNLGPRISRRVAQRVLMAGRLGSCRDTARAHVSLLTEAGEFIPHGDCLVLRSFRGVVGYGPVKEMLRAPEFWAARREAKLARRRAIDARRRAAKRQQRDRRLANAAKRAAARRAKKRCKNADFIGKIVPKSVNKSKAYAIGRLPVKDGAAGVAAATPSAPSFKKSRLRAQKPRPRPATKAPVVLPTPAPPPTPVFVAAYTHQDTPEAIARARAAFMALPWVKPPPPADDAPGDDTGLTGLGVLLGRAFDAAESAAPRPPPPDTAPPLLTARELAIARLAHQRGMAGLNLRAVTKTGAPLPIIVEALGVVADAGRRARNPPAFFLGTVRRLMLQRRAGVCVGAPDE